MKLNDFFIHASQANFFAEKRIINLIVPGPSPVLFVQALAARLQKILGLPLVWCDLDKQLPAALEAQLATSFLGSANLYVLSVENAKNFGQFLQYLEAYEGMHTVLCITKQEQALRERGTILTIFVDETIDARGYQQLYQFLYNEEMADIRFVQELFRRVPQLPFDTACLLMHYQQLVGKNNQQFFASWFNRIVEQKQSLFSLSQYLFARDRKNFYGMWHAVAQEYPPEFWIAFWSEQLWQALIFVTIAQADGVHVAKKSVSRLPFSFMQKDWHKHSLGDLTQAYDMLYTIDCYNKNGAITDGLALWHAKFLA